MGDFVYLVMNYLADQNERIVSERVVAVFQNRGDAYDYLVDIYKEFSVVAGINNPGPGRAIFNDYGRFDHVELESDKELYLAGVGGTSYEIVPFALGRP